MFLQMFRDTALPHLLKNFYGTKFNAINLLVHWIYYKMMVSAATGCAQLCGRPEQ
jgi:hypothetical protein